MKSKKTERKEEISLKSSIIDQMLEIKIVKPKKKDLVFKAIETLYLKQ